MSELIVLVNESGEAVGVEEKLAAHQNGGMLHRAFSIFIFNSESEMLIQKRSTLKYHSGNLWTNACCSHQRHNELLHECVHRRLLEEMGFDCPLEEAFTFTYKTDFDNGLTEWEYDHVWVGKYSGKVVPNPAEASEYKWVNTGFLLQDVAIHPDNYTVWFKLALQRVVDRISQANLETR